MKSLKYQKIIQPPKSFAKQPKKSQETLNFSTEIIPNQKKPLFFKASFKNKNIPKPKKSLKCDQKSKLFLIISKFSFPLRLVLN
jgi:hypothetical protein